MTIRAGGLLLSGLLWFALPALALSEPGTIKINLRFEGSGTARPAVDLIVRPAAIQAGTGQAEPRHIPVSPTSSATEVSVAPGSWSVSVAAEGYWAAEKMVDVEAGTRSNATLAVWQSGRVQGTQSPPKAATDITIDFEPTPPASKKQPRGGIRCPVKDGHWSCDLPAGTFDLRIGAKGFVPVYRWGLDVPKGGTRQAGQVMLIPGASISGFVSRDSLSPLCRVELSTSEGGAVIPPKRGTPSTPGAGYSSPTDDRGFFQIKAVPPSDYAVRAICQNRRSGPVAVRVYKDSETRLLQAIRFTELVFMDVSITPALSPTGRPWTVEVENLADLSGESRVRKQPSPDGRARFDELSPGDYAVAVEGDDGARWFSDEVHVDPPSGQLDVKLDSVRLAGTITLGSQPLKARLFFGGEHGPISIPLASDEAGHFAGLLPSALGEKWAVDIQADDPPVVKHLQDVEVHRNESTSEASVEITLEASTLKGVVIDESGQPLHGAIVRIQPLSQKQGVERWVSLVSDAEGRFETAGLPPGRVSVTAQTGDAIAEPQEVLVSWKPVEVRLIARRGLRLRGHVVSAETAEPLPGAFLLAGSDGPLRAHPARGHTDAEGNFTLTDLPRGTTAVDLVVGAPGYVTQLQRIAVSPEPLTLSLGRTGGGSIRLAIPQGWNPRDLNMPGPVLFHGGSTTPVVWLFAYATMNGVMNGDPKLFVLPQMAAGHYEVCMLPFLELGTFPQNRTSCLSGDLADGGVLEWTMADESGRSAIQR